MGFRRMLGRSLARNALYLSPLIAMVAGGAAGQALALEPPHGTITRPAAGR